MASARSSNKAGGSGRGKGTGSGRTVVADVDSPRARAQLATPEQTPGPDGLDPADPGLCAMADLVGDLEPAQVLLVHCGHCVRLRPGAVRLVLDCRELEDQRNRLEPIALDLAPPNLAGFRAALCWPRAHLGKDFALRCFADGGLRLENGGRLLVAVKKSKGAKSLASALEQLFGAVQTVDRHRGHHILCATRGPAFNESLARAWLTQELVITDPELPDLALRSRPGVFSWRNLDAGTAALCGVLRVLARPQATAGPHMPDPASVRAQLGLSSWPDSGAATGSGLRVLDLCAGLGPLGWTAARLWPSSHVLAVESNFLAGALAADNAVRNRLQDRCQVVVDDGLGPKARALGENSGHLGATDLAVVNPPTHAPAPVLGAMIETLMQWLAPGGRALLVVKRHGTLLGIAARLNLRVDWCEVAGYAIVCLRPPAGDP